jgi:uncharacterized delta-60 repeat protein
MPWAKSYGGSKYTSYTSIQQTIDGGYIVVGYTNSFGAGSYDAWILKLNSTGGVVWQKPYGWSDGDYAYSIQQTVDGGYIVAGMTYYVGAGAQDAWVLKLNSTGGVVWQKTYGGSTEDRANFIQQTADGGYIVVGYTTSFGTSGGDVWVLKLDSNGNVGPGYPGTWQKTYGGASADFANSIQQTEDGGYILTGTTDSISANDWDVWVLKLDSNGNVGSSYPGTWQKTYGGSDADKAYSIHQTSDGGYIVAGSSYSFGVGTEDAWALKLDSNGNVGPSYPGTWQKTYGGIFADDIKFIQQTTDGGYIVAGETYSFGAGSYDAWILKLNSTGGVIWQKTYGGSGGDIACYIQQTTDGGYIVTGETYSFGTGFSDCLVLKLDSNGNIGGCPVQGLSTIITKDTAITGVDTSITGITSMGIVNTTGIADQNTSIIPYTVCE